MIPVIGIPVLNRSTLLARGLLSIDYPVEHVVIVNNGQDRAVAATIEQFASDGRLPITAITPGVNLGCAASWNRIMREFPEAAYWLLIGNDMMMMPGDLAKMDQWIRQHLDYACCPANWGHSLFAVTQAGLRDIGWFDENMYPAYCEDQDHSYRIKLSGKVLCDVPDVRAVHGEPPTWGSSTVFGDPILFKRCQATQRNNHTYYEAKWGGPPGQETFTHPYNDTELTWKDWIFDNELAEANENPLPSLAT